ncbi:MAG: hypothetical protein U1G05_05370 [Kiritimatiellia bacterium]
MPASAMARATAGASAPRTFPQSTSTRELGRRSQAKKNSSPRTMPPAAGGRD